MSAVLAAATNAPAEDAPPKPNIIFILADDLGYGDLGSYGQQKIKTPRLDQMAEEGIRFLQAYAGSTVCAPSRCSLMTGLHTGHARIRGNKDVPLEPEDVTVAEVLKGAGYHTGLIGKWGLGNHDTTGTPNKQGFDYFFGYLDQKHAHTYYPTYLWRNEEKVPLENEESEPNVATKRVQYSHDLFTDEALKYVAEQKANPFFLYLAYTIPHTNNERGHRHGDGMEVPELGDYADTDWPPNEKAKAAMISRLDRDVGRLLDKLRELGIAENTCVFFSSDNGPHKEGVDPEFFDSNAHLKGIKRDLYEGGIRVPMIAWWPGKIEHGVTDAVITFWDFLPTAATLAGAEAPTSDGLSFADYLLRKSQFPPVHDYLYWEFHERGFSQAVRVQDYKLVRPGSKAPDEFYIIKTHSRESVDLAGMAPQLQSELEALLTEARTPSPHWPAPGEGEQKE